MTHRPLFRRLRLFGQDETASLSVEAVIVVPFLVWAFLGIFMLTDTFRALHANTVSTYSIGDALSRETEPVSASYIEGLNTLHAVMSRAQTGTQLRATMIHYDGATQSLKMQWSHATTGRTALTQATLSEVSARIPTLANGEAVIVVETWKAYAPTLVSFIGGLNIYDIVVTRPRFAPTVAWGTS